MCFNSPLSTDGNGIPDGEETFNQVTEKALTSHDSAVSNVRVEMTTGGNLARNLNVESLYEIDTLSSEIGGLIGDPVNFDTTSDFEEATLTFKVDKTKLAEGVDFDNLAVLWYDEANQAYELVPSELNTEESTVTATVNHFSTYMLVPLPQWNTTWQLAPKYNFGTHMYAVIDGVYGDSQRYCESLGGHSVTITSAEEQAHVMMLMMARGTSDAYWLGLNRESSPSGAFKWVTDEPYGYSNWASGEPSTSTSAFQTAKMFGPQSAKGGQWYTKPSLIIDGFGNTGFICEWEDYASFEQASSILDKDGDGLPDFMEIGGIPLPNGQIVYTDPNNPDTDGDGVLDGDEIAIKMQIVDWDAAHNPIYGFTGFIFRSNPTVADSDRDGISDKDDTAIWQKGLEGGIIGALKICSYGTGPSSSGNFSGHAFLAYTSFVNDSVSFYGIKVNSYEERADMDGVTRSNTAVWNEMSFTPNTVTTIGAWAGWLPDRLKGTWVNNELAIIQHGGIPSDQRSIMRYVTSNDLKKISTLTKTHSKWTKLYNCSAFATDVWNETFGDSLSAYGLGFRNPSSLSYNIEKRAGYKIADKLLTDMP